MTFAYLAGTCVKTVIKAVSEYYIIDVAFDKFKDETTKGTIRMRRSKEARPIRRLVEYRVLPLPKDWSNFLSLADNKTDLAHFLSEELCSQAPVDKQIVVSVGFRDELDVKSSTGATDLGPMEYTHEEADTMLCLYIHVFLCLHLCFIQLFVYITLLNKLIS